MPCIATRCNPAARTEKPFLPCTDHRMAPARKASAACRIWHAVLTNLAVLAAEVFLAGAILWSAHEKRLFGATPPPAPKSRFCRAQTTEWRRPGRPRLRAGRRRCRFVSTACPIYGTQRGLFHESRRNIERYARVPHLWLQRYWRHLSYRPSTMTKRSSLRRSAAGRTHSARSSSGTIARSITCIPDAPRPRRCARCHARGLL